MVDREWVNATAARVVAAYQNYNANRNPFVSAPTPEHSDAIGFDGYIPSSRGDGAYHVVVTPTTASCECLGFTKYNRGRDCSHITKVKDALRNG